MARRITERLTHVAPDVRAIVLTGSERCFCSGANLWEGDHFDLASPDFDAGEILATVINPMMQALKESPVPIISAVRGSAAGVGASLALCADIVIAAEGAFLVQSFSRVGLIPDGGTSFLLARSIGRIRAFELLLLGERLPVEKALEWGLITRVVQDGEVERVALDMASRLAQGPTRALALTRRAMWAGAVLGWEEELALECDLQREATRSADFQEGMAAFAERRDPRFSGA
jgi:2-(1,2-epoxy-1,2-dihydrophenyl)acetyl-CoA isomerase